VNKTKKALIAHEDTFTGGWGAEVAALISQNCFYDLKAPVQRIAAYDVPLPVTPVLEQAVVPSVERIKEKIRQLHKMGKS
jgi:pyruvate/2-oxoglutarate/acetoin dehydrogenase E1 component